MNKTITTAIVPLILFSCGSDAFGAFEASFDGDLRCEGFYEGKASMVTCRELERDVVHNVLRALCKTGPNTIKTQLFNTNSCYNKAAYDTATGRVN